MSSNQFNRSLAPAFVALITLLGAAACADRAPLAPDPRSLATVPSTRRDAAADSVAAVAALEPTEIETLRRVTARYHRIDAARADGFVFLHGCEVRTEEGPVGTVYINFERLLDGRIDPALPDGLIYEPVAPDSLRLVAVELAVPFGQVAASEPPTFLGHPFQSEDEFGVFGLHVWVWRDNPDGMFAETNPKISCTAQ